MRKLLFLIVAIVFAGILFWYFGRNGNSPVPLGNVPPITLEERTVTFADGTQAAYLLASDFNIAVAAENLGKARFLAMSPDGRLFVPDMINFNDNTQGKIYILSGFNGQTLAFEKRVTYLSGLRNPNSITFYTDIEGKNWIYIALTEKLIRYPYSAGDERPASPPQLITTFPDYRTVDGDIWHITRTIEFVGDELFVSIGSSCNVCEEPEGEARAEILAMGPTGENARTYAKGLRNAVGIEWANDALYATVNGVDHHGTDAPDDVMHKIVPGTDYGFPYCHEDDGKIKEEKNWPWLREPLDCDTVPLSFASFGPHAAPLGLTYFEDAHPVLDDSFLVALHGSFRIEIGKGYKIVRVSGDGRQDTFMEGFLKENSQRTGRPVHVLQKDSNSFFFTDDLYGRLYYVHAK